MEYLPKLLSGEILGSYCLYEDDAGSDYNSVKTSATLTEDGKHYVFGTTERIEYIRGEYLFLTVDRNQSVFSMITVRVYQSALA